MSTPQEFISYRYENLFTIDYPSNWLPISDLQFVDEDLVIMFSPFPSIPDSLLSLAIAILDRVDSKTYEHIDLQLIYDIRNNKNLEFIESTDNAKVGGQQAFQILQKDLIANTMHLNVYTLKQHKVYHMTYNSKEEEYNQYFPTIAHMINSFQFVT